MALSPNKRLKAKSYRKRLPSVLPAVNALLLAIEQAKPSPRLPADLLSQYRSTLRMLVRKARHIQRLDARRSALLTTIKWQRQQGARLASTADRNATLAWLLNSGRRNVHAAALGKLGAESRWKKHRERKALLCLEDAHV